MSKFIHLSVKDKEEIKKQIDYLFVKRRKSNMLTLRKIFGADLAKSILDIICEFQNRMFFDCDYSIRYIDIYDELEKRLGFIFDLGYFEATNFWFSDKGSLFSDEDAQLIFEVKQND